MRLIGAIFDHFAVDLALAIIDFAALLAVGVVPHAFAAALAVIEFPFADFAVLGIENFPRAVQHAVFKVGFGNKRRLEIFVQGTGQHWRFGRAVPAQPTAVTFAVTVFAAADQTAFFIPLGPQTVVVVVAFGVLGDVPFDLDRRVREPFADHFDAASSFHGRFGRIVGGNRSGFSRSADRKSVVVAGRGAAHFGDRCFCQGGAHIGRQRGRRQCRQPQAQRDSQNPMCRLPCHVFHSFKTQRAMFW